MKTFFRLPNLLLLALAIFTFAACTEDEGFVIPPSVELLSEAGFISGDADVDASATFSVKVNATKGDNPMNALEILQDGARIDVNKIMIDGAPATSAAPILFDADKDAFTWTIDIISEAEGTSSYSFVVSDEAGESSSTGLTATVVVVAIPPSIEIEGPATINTTPGTPTGFTINVTGSGLTTLAVFEDGSEITDTDRLTFGDPGVEITSPYFLDAADADGFSTLLSIRSSSAAGAQNYEIKVTDASEQSASATIAFQNGTPLSFNMSGVLLNKSGPDGQGGLDLDTGNGMINSTDAAAEIKDEGIDTNLPTDANWLQLISPTAGNQMGNVTAANFPDGGNFDNINTKEELQAVVQSTPQISVSDKVNIGDMFGVYSIAQDRYYLIRVSNVETTDNDNKDQYTFDIKW